MWPTSLRPLPLLIRYIHAQVTSSSYGFPFPPRGKSKPFTFKAGKLWPLPAPLRLRPLRSGLCLHLSHAESLSVPPTSRPCSQPEGFVPAVLLSQSPFLVSTWLAPHYSSLLSSLLLLLTPSPHSIPSLRFALLLGITTAPRHLAMLFVDGPGGRQVLGKHLLNDSPLVRSPHPPFLKGNGGRESRTWMPTC